MEAIANRITPDKITELDEDQIFVFGSNKAGLHGAGAAKTALRWGAQRGIGYGRSGSTFAIPTKNERIQSMEIEDIKFYVSAFIAYARLRTDKVFLVTEIGCGLAGYKPEQIAPLFRAAANLDNVCLPERFWEVLNEN